MKFKFTILIFSFSINYFYSQQKVDTDIRRINFESIYSQIENSRSEEIDITIPEIDPNQVFHLIPSNVLGDEFKRDNPTIKTYFIENKGKISGSFTINHETFYLDYNSYGKQYSIAPNHQSPNQDDFILEIERKPLRFGMCATDHSESRVDIESIRKSIQELNGNRSQTLKTFEYRMAIVATGEFYVANGNSLGLVNMAIANSVNGISAIYMKTVSTKFKLINAFAYTNPATDPFIPDESGGQPRPTQAAIQVPVIFTNPNAYDIGHVLHKHSSGDGWSSGGVALLKSVCKTGNYNGGQIKAAGWSGSFTTSGFEWLSLFAHEIGHQFSMTHTFNGTGSSCTDAISEDTAVEIASGTTIMSYNGICEAAQNVPSNGEADNYFHYISVGNFLNYTTNDIPNCPVQTNITNSPPVVNHNPCGAIYKLPKGTPYYLKGSATDVDGDALFYAWEQFDEDGPGIKPTQGNIGSVAGGKKKTPLMKNFPPSPSNERYFPDVATVAKGNSSDPFQALANVDRDINFAFSARDFKSTGSIATYKEMKLIVDANGPLSVVYPNFSETFNAGQTIKAKWTTNNSDNLCNKASISLSIDGGLSFPYILKQNFNYGDDSIDITIPGFITNTSTARIKVSCEDYDCFKFYDISNQNFTINSPCLAPQSIICPSNNLSFDKGDPNLDLNLKSVLGKRVSSMQKRLTTSSPFTKAAVRAQSGSGCATKSDTYTESIKFSVSKTGEYVFNVDVDFQQGFGFATIVREANYNANNPCPSFVASSGIDAGALGVSATGSITATLNECENYLMLFYNYGPKPVVTSIPSISGPGLIIEKPNTPPTDFSTVYIAVRKADNIVSAVSADANFISLGPGVYDVYGMVVKSSGPTPPNITNYNNYLGKEFNSFYIPGDCFQSSLNSFELEVKGSCSLESVKLLQASPCDPMNNNVTQPIEIKYTTAPSQINVNGTLYNATGSPQVINYVTKSTGLTENIEIFFVAEPTCKTTLSFETPKNCCPFEIGVKNEERGCEGVPLTITANPNLGIYNWLNEAGTVLSTTNQLTTSTPGKYKIRVSSLTGCEKTQEVQVSFEATPTVSLPADVTICDGVEFLIVATTNASFMQWFRNDTLVQEGPSKTLKTTTKGRYKIQAGNSVQCQVSDEIIVSTKPSPKPNLGNDKEICEGSSTTLSITDNGTVTWFKDNVQIPGQMGKTLTVSEEGIYKVVVKGANDCQNEDQIVVRVYELPIIEAGPNLEFCSGKDVTIRATSNTQNFQWFKNDQPFPQVNLEFTTNQPGEYKIVAQNAIGCKIADSLIVTENPIPQFNLGQNRIGCTSNGVNADITLNGPSGTGYTYQWQRNGNNIPGGQNITVNQMGLYTLIVTDAKGCTNLSQVNVEYKPGPSVSLNQTKVEFCQGESFDIVATTSATKIEWLKDGNVITGQTGKTLKINAAGTYKIRASGGTGGPADCVVEETITAVVNPLLNVNVKDTTACEGEKITIQSNVNANNYEWKFNGQTVGTNKTFEPKEAGKYTLVVTSNKGCKSSDDVNVTFSARPSVSIPQSLNYCKGDNVKITANSNGTTFKWTINGNVVAGATTKEINVNGSGLYVIEASFNGACPRKDTTVVTERNLPTVNLGPDKDLCPNDSIKLDAGNPNNKYLWSTGDTTKTINVKNKGQSVSTTINVTVTNQFNCKSSDEIVINFIPKSKLKLDASATGICGGDSLTLTVSGGEIYKWEGPANTFKIITPDKIIVFPSANTIYKVSTSSNKCLSNKDTISKTVNIFELKPVSAGNDTCVVLGKSIKLKATGGTSYTWKADETIVKGANTATPEVAPLDPTVYVVFVKDKNGCVQVDSVEVCVIDDPLKTIKPINMITPNGDGLNDVLEFIGLNAFDDNNIIIYNRWGNIVYEKTRYQFDGERFDGKRSGEELPADTYYYVLKFGENIIKQSLTIIREK